MNQALAEHRLQNLQAKLRRDAERGDMAAVDRDVRRIDNLKYRIVIDEWLIRWNSRRIPLLLPDPDRCRVARRHRSGRHTRRKFPTHQRSVPTPGPIAAAPTIPITIVNAEPAGAGVAFAIDGVAHQAPAGSRQDLAVAPDSNITYDGGGSLGQRRYRISPGLYEFRSTAEGWALYKLAGTP